MSAGRPCRGGRSLHCVAAPNCVAVPNCVAAPVERNHAAAREPFAVLEAAAAGQSDSSIGPADLALNRASQNCRQEDSQEPVKACC